MKDFSEQLTGRHILVTGGAGFIGSNLVEQLLALGCRVTVLDNFSTGKRENVAPFLKHSRFRLVEGDLRDLECCCQAVDGVDAVLHQGALGSVPRSIANPSETIGCNIQGFVNLVSAVREKGGVRIVYASSSSVYGDNRTLPAREENIGRQLSPYAISKYADELLAANFHALYGIDFVGLRYFNVFGQRQDPFGPYAAVIPLFAMRMLKGERPVINGDGSISRDFTYIANVVQANLRALTVDNPETLNRVYNIACGQTTTLNELFLALRDGLSAFRPELSAIEPVHGPERQGDIPHSLADISRAREYLGYCPEVTVHEGLRLAAEWYYRNLQA